MRVAAAPRLDYHAAPPTNHPTVGSISPAQALRASISDAALAEDAAAESKLAAAAQQLDRLAESLQALDARQGSLQVGRQGHNMLPLRRLHCLGSPSRQAFLPPCIIWSWQAERYRRFHAALTSVNEKLGGIYAQLTGGQGDAYCRQAWGGVQDDACRHPAFGLAFSPAQSCRMSAPRAPCAPSTS